MNVNYRELTVNCRKLLLSLLVLLPFCACHAQPVSNVSQGPAFRTGADSIVNNYYVQGECFGATVPLTLVGDIAVVANQTSIVGNTHLVDTLLSEGVHITKIFCPEHGFRGTAEAGAKVDNSTDPKTGIPIISLYGKNKKPTPEQMKDIDVVIFDLQDVGCRFYTYISTLHYVMEACAENNVPLIVLDRPNPNGHYVDGPVLDTATCRSFVGMHPVPIVYGMTIGEYAMMINGEGWLNVGRQHLAGKNSTDAGKMPAVQQCDLTVVPMQGYKRDSVGYELPVPPSPNLRNAHAIALYPSLCLFEGTNVSVGRGTDSPFEIIGIPGNLCTWIELGSAFSIAGQWIPSCTFKTNDGKTYYGINLHSINVPAKFDLSYILTMYSLTKKGQFFLKTNFFDKLAGTTELSKQIESGMSEEEIRASWQPALDEFMKIREKYLIYR